MPSMAPGEYKMYLHHKIIAFLCWKVEECRIDAVYCNLLSLFLLRADNKFWEELMNFSYLVVA